MKLEELVIKEDISIITTGPNEWLIISNNIIKNQNNNYELENIYV